jgi:membrane protein
VRSWLARTAEAVRQYARDVWACDRAALTGWQALKNRVLRIAIWTVRGVFTHRLSLHAAALTHHTIFSVVPVLVVVVWALKAFHLLPYLIPAAPKLEAALPATAAQASDPLSSALRTIMTAVQHANQIKFGLVGLLALFYGAAKLFRQVSRAIDMIAGATHRARVYWRLLGYVALILLPLVLLLIAGAVTALSRIAEGTFMEGALSRVLGAIPELRSALGAMMGIAVFALTIAIFYASAARARLRFSSAAIGGLAAAVALIAVTWAFTRFQIGVTKASVLASGVAALPVFLLWAFVCWFIVLIGAEIAVGHDLDGTLRHGARIWDLQPLAEEAAGAGLMIEVARRADPPTTQELARQLRLLPATVRALVARLTKAGLLRRTDAGGVALACDPDATKLGDVVDAVAGHLELDSSQRALAAVLGQRRLPHAGPSLRELAAADQSLQTVS